MDKFTVIIPTIWKSKYTLELLKRYSDCEHIGEIILIDNASHLNKNIDLPKVVHIKEKTNTFVNPAWNKGIFLSKYNNITISNDDILFDVNFYYDTMKTIDDNHPFKDVGIIGMHSDNYNLKKNNEQIIIEPYNNKNNIGGWGCLFSFYKSYWRLIPNELKIWYGDNWLQMVTGPILQLKGVAAKTKMSTSSDLAQVRSVRDNDTIEWEKIYKIIAAAIFRIQI